MELYNKHFYRTKIGLVLFVFSVTFLTVQSQVIPQKNDNKYSLEVGNLYFEVDADFGARITSFKIDGEEFLTTAAPANVSTFWGSTVWIIPEGDNDNSSDYDRGRYTATIEGSKMRFVSKVVTDKANISLQLIKEFTAKVADTSILIKYSLVNKNGSAIEKAIWPVTRTVAEGLTFWPEGKVDAIGNLASEIEYNNGYSWMMQDQTGMDRKKFKADGEEGWFAHATPNNKIFIKKFEDVAPADFAPNEGEIEYWVHTDFAYIELENQSAFTEIADEDTLHYEVKWYLRDLPGKYNLEVGNLDLVTYAEQIMAPPATGGGSSLAHKASRLNVKLFPNPAVNQVSVLFDDYTIQEGTIEFFNITGKHALKTKFSKNETIDISSLSKGLYTYSINSGKQIYYGKLIKH